MVSALAASGIANLCLAFAALFFSTFLDPQEAPLLHSAPEVLPLAAVVVLFAAVAVIYHHLSRHHAAAVPVAGAAGNRRRLIPGLVMFALFVSAGTLEFILFEQAGGGGAGHGAQARALGLAALRALPTVATVTFFCGMMLIVASAALVRAGGEAGGIGGVAGDGPMQGLLRLLTKIAAGAAAALIGLMAIALTA